MNKTKIYQLVFITLIVMNLTGCTYSPPKTMVRIGGVSKIENTYSFSVALIYTKYRDPTGFISTFPNGGIPEILEESVLFYLCNVVTKEARFLAEIKAPFKGMKRLKPWLGGWDKDSFYFSLTYGESWDKGYKRYYFKMNQDGKFQQVQLDALPNQPGESLARMTGEKNYMRLSTASNPLAVTARIKDGGEFLPIFVVDEDHKMLVPVSN